MRMNIAALRAAGILISLGVMNAVALASPRGAEGQAGAENQGATPPAPASVLQVTGTTNSFTISAQHADVLSLLKLVFNQSHRQFVPDASVTGDVTFALSGQRFETVLAAICQQTFLRYEVDKLGIYRFRRDEEGLRNLLLKTQAINNVLSDQLRRMGYAVPTTLLGMEGANRSNARGGIPGSGGGAVNGAFGANRAGSEFSGGFGGGGGNNTTNGFGRGRGEGSSNAPAAALGTDSIGAGRRSAGSSKDERVGSADTKAKQSGKPDSRGGVEGTQKPFAFNRQSGGGIPGGPGGPPGSAGPTAEQETNSLAAGINRDGQTRARNFASPEMDLSDSGQYQTFKKQNSFVSINTQGEKVPVRQILADLSRQSGIPILIDPDVPKGEEFRVIASIPACPLNVMLNILGYRARLEWRYVNGRIYVTTTPELQLYLRGAILPPPGNGGNIGNGITVLPQRSAAPATQAPPQKPEDAEKDKTDKKVPPDKGG